MRSKGPSAVLTLRIRNRFAFVATLSLLAALLVNLSAPSVAAAAGPYNAQHLVARVLDGDTIEVYPAGQTSGTVEVVRFTGVNTNETGMCHAAAATDRLRDLIDGEWVTLKADDASSKATEGRSLRYVEHNGVDLSLLMIQESHGFAFPNGRETGRNHQYVTASYYASLAGQRIWDPTSCGNGPSQNVPLRMIINWDAPGIDGSPGTYNGEWFRVFNDGSSNLSVGGWKIRDTAAQNIYSLPAGTQIPAHGYLTIYAGSGSNTPTKVYLGLTVALFNNHVGDAGFLLDPDDDIRVHFAYPCLVDCSDELQGAMDISANADAEGNDNANPNGEWINITNTSGASFNLYGYLLRSGGKLYTFPSNSTVHPGERLRLYVGSGADSRLTKHWGRPDGILANNGPESISIVTYDDIELSSFSWPCNPCGPIADISIFDYQWDSGPGPDDPRDEWIEIKNDGNSSVDLRDWLVMDNINRYYFDDSFPLAPGAKLRLYVGNGSDTGNTLYWDMSQEILFSNDMIQVYSPHRDLVDCTAWGDKSCGPAAVPSSCNGLTATIVGSGASEVIHGTSGNDVIVGAGGNDTIYGNGGNDTICGNDGSDTLRGGNGHDTLLGGGGDDTLIGNSGNDTMRGDGGTDRVRYDSATSGVTVDLAAGTATGDGSDTLGGVEHVVGSDYADHLYGDAGNNLIDGGAGNDVIKGRGGKDTLDGQDGDDTIKGGGRADKIWGGNGTDVIDGGAGPDLIRGGPEDDILKGRSGIDTIYGQAGRDKLYGGPNADNLDGGRGIDRCTSGKKVACES